MKRRTFLLSAALGAASLIGLRLGLSSEEDAIVKVIHKRLDYLKLDPDGVRRFARDVTRMRLISPARLHFIDAAGPLYTQTDVAESHKLGLMLRHGEDRIVGAFLISSDFFRHHADESRSVQYERYFDSTLACSNPFARLVPYYGSSPDA